VERCPCEGFQTGEEQEIRYFQEWTALPEGFDALEKEGY
jgi:hypothetical protein